MTNTEYWTVERMRGLGWSPYLIAISQQIRAGTYGEQESVLQLKELETMPQLDPDLFHGEPMQAEARLVNEMDKDLNANKSNEAITRELDELRFQLMVVLRRSASRRAS